MCNLHFVSKNTWNAALIAGVFLLPGCKRPSYTSRPLDTITPFHNATQTQAGVTLTLSPLTKKESKHLFDSRGDRLLSKRKPLHPVLITIKNESTQTYTFDPQTVEFKLCKPYKVARRMYGHTSRHIIAPLVIGSLGATICFFGAAYLVILGTIQQVAMPVLVKAGYTLLGISGLVAIGTPYISYRHGSHSYALNAKIDHDVRTKTIISPIEITAGTTTSFLLFVEKRHCPWQWDIILTSQEGTTLSYHLCIQKGGTACVA